VATQEVLLLPSLFLSRLIFTDWRVGQGVLLQMVKLNFWFLELFLRYFLKTLFFADPREKMYIHD